MTRRPPALVLVTVAWLSAGCIPEADEGVLGGVDGGTTASGGAQGTGGFGAGTGGATGATGGVTGATGGVTSATGGRAGTGGRTGTGGGGIPACQTALGGTTGSTGANDPLNAAAKCSSGRMWSSGNGATMMPGDRCQGCHLWTVAGTIYPTGHEPTYCNGLSDSSVSVVITDSQCRVITLTPNAAGNFYYAGTVVGELAVKVVRGQTERRMVTRAPHGECNACHTPTGIQGAPGRIVPPP